MDNLMKYMIEYTRYATSKLFSIIWKSTWSCNYELGDFVVKYHLFDGNSPLFLFINQ